MSRILWVRRVLGRSEGDIENVETDTDFMRAVLENSGAYVILPDEDPEPAEVEQPHVEVIHEISEAPKARGRKAAHKEDPEPSGAEELAEAQGVPAEDAKDA